MKKEKPENSCKIIHFLWALQKKIWGHAFQAHKAIIRIVSIFITTSKTTTAWISKPYIILGPSYCAKEVM